MIIKEFFGYSKSKIYLIKENDFIFVRKLGDVQKNYERLTNLEKEGYPVSKVLDYKDGVLDIEYIEGIDMRNYLQRNRTDSLRTFLIELFHNLNKNSIQKDYSDFYNTKLSFVKDCNLPFTFNELISRLPKTLPQSTYHGDLTLENIIYNEQRGFVLIDGLTTEYDSWVFDMAKLNQDLRCKWFLRNSNTNLDLKLQKINQSLQQEFGKFDDSIIIAMLLRVYNYAKDDIITKKFLECRMKELWK